VSNLAELVGTKCSNSANSNEFKVDLILAQSEFVATMNHRQLSIMSIVVFQSVASELICQDASG